MLRKSLSVAVVTTIILFSGCSAHNVHINNLKDKNKPLYSIFKYAKTVLVIDKSSPNYGTFKKIFIGNGNFTTSKKIEECDLAGTTYCCYTAESKYNTFDEYKKCIGSEHYEPIYTMNIESESVLAAQIRMNIAKKSCDYMRLRNMNSDYETCINERYKPSSSNVSMNMNGVKVRVNENNVYGTIQRNLERKMPIDFKSSYDLFTEYTIGIIEIDEKNAEIVVSVSGSFYISPTYSVEEKPKIVSDIVNRLESLNIKYKYVQ